MTLPHRIHAGLAPLVSALSLAAAWGPARAETPEARAEWESRYRAGSEKPARLDDGFLLSVGAGYSPTRITARLDAPDTAGFPDVDFVGGGGVIDFRMGWLVLNDMVLGRLIRTDAVNLHDQVYLGADVITRTTVLPRRRYKGGDTALNAVFFRPLFLNEIILGGGLTYLIYPSRTSFSISGGLASLGIQGSNRGVRTGFAPMYSIRAAQEWPLRENWRTGLAVSFARYSATNDPEDQENFTSPREKYSSRMLQVLWINSFTPPKYRRGVPPTRPTKSGAN
jgi:hypothetical protein